MAVILSLLPLILIVVSLADIITRDQSQMKHLPKFAWILLVVFLPIVGSLLWFAIGREYRQAPDRGGFGDPRRRSKPGAPSTPPRAPARQLSTEEQLAAIDAEIVYHEQQARARKLQNELEARRRANESNVG